ncbi:MAG: type VI secretion system-associated FHA domain protein TagH [Pseudomonadales bacterium]
MGLRLLVQKGDEAVGTFEVSSAKYGIGRSADNALALTSDSVISRNHAYIEAADSGEWALVDVSANGVLHNDQPLRKDTPQTLKDGDLIEIGTYRLTVAISGADAAVEPGAAISAAERDPLALLTGGAGASAKNDHPTGQSSVIDDLINEPVVNEAMDLPGFAEDPFAPKAKPAAEPDSGGLPDWARPTGESPVSVTPAPATPPATLDDPFATAAKEPAGLAADPFAANPGAPVAASNPNAPEPPVPMPTAAPNPPAPGSTDASALDALAQGLGLPPGALTDAAQAQMIGGVLKSLLAGVVDVLLNRAELKNQMKLQRTILQSQDNNPIKMAPNAEAAVRWLFTDQQVGFLDAEAAAADVMLDISAHELSMIAGLQAAQEAVTKGLNPDYLEQRFSEQVNMGGIGVLEKSRYWQLFRSYYSTEVVNQDMMISNFAEAYEATALQVRRQGHSKRGAQ